MAGGGGRWSEGEVSGGKEREGGEADWMLERVRGEIEIKEKIEVML